MNHASLESAKRWQDLGLFQDSEFVYAQAYIFTVEGDEHEIGSVVVKERKYLVENL